jgi:REP element-mobilizing transposase RayT
MPRQARLDAPGTLHHTIGRGIEGVHIFRTTKDRNDFLTRLAELCEAEALSVYAWALMDNHFHLLVRTGKQPLSQNMRKVLTGYVVNFNRRYRRYGHLFQNRYKSILCEEDPYLLEVTRYIHLNPVRAGMTNSLRQLKVYPWTGHAVIMGEEKRTWQDVEAILSYFGKRKKEAVWKYEHYIQEGMRRGSRPELVGGGLVRSVGGWSEVVSLKRKGEKIDSDERILGSGDFVERMLSEAEEKVKETLRWRQRVPDLKTLLTKVAGGEGVQEERVRGGDRTRRVTAVRRLFCYMAVKRLGYSGAAVARFLGVTTSLVNRLANSDGTSGVDQYVE